MRFVVLALAALAACASASSPHPRGAHAAPRERGRPARLAARATTASAAAPTYTHLGCYKDSSAPRTMPYSFTESTSMTPATCVAHCEAAGYSYAGLEAGWQCWCGTAPPANTLAASSCSVACEGDSSVTCGAAWILDVYEYVAPSVAGTTHLGCYSDSSAPRVLPYAMTQATDMTPAVCVAHCAASGYTYAGLEAGYQCWCGSSLASSPVSASTCTSACWGDSDVTCGGSWRLDVYIATGAATTSAAATTAAATTTKTTAAAATTTSAAAMTHLGCYKDSSSPRALPYSMMQSTSMTPTMCYAHCAASGYAYAGIEAGWQCWCGSSISTAALAASSCSMACEGDASLTCGGNWILDVYVAASATTAKTTTTTTSTTTTTAAATKTTTTAAAASTSAAISHLGCYKDSSAPRLLPSAMLQSTSMTPTMCYAHCAASGYTYAGIEAGWQCWCGSTLSASQIAASSCSMACEGDASLTCGASYVLDIYVAASMSTSTSTTKAATTSSTTTTKAATTTAYALSASSNAAATLITTTVAPAAAATTKALYAHVIMGNTYGYGTTEWASEIALAKTAGIDGFAMNLGQAQYEYDAVDALYSAAASAGGFTLFFSFDFTAFSCSSYSDGSTVAGLINKYKGSSAQAMYNGKPLVSTFSGDSCYFGQGSVANGWNNVVRALVGSMYLVPAIFSDTSTFAAATWFDGELNWNSGWPMAGADLDTSSDQTYLAALGSKSYMPAISPCFFTYYGPNSYNKDWIYRSDDWLLATRLESLIGMRDKYPFAELISWNDFGESHYIGPIAIDSNQPNSASWVDAFPHTAWLGLIGYYAPALKTGVYPAPTDQLYLWSRPHSKNASPSNPTNAKPTNWAYTDDKLYAIAILASPATVTVTSGSNAVSYYLNTGVNKISLASATGTITGKIVRNGATVKSYDSTGAFSYTANPTDYNFNYFVASA